jgi:hypothetical protein
VAIGWVEERLYSVILEVKEDREGEYYYPWFGKKQAP